MTQYWFKPKSHGYGATPQLEGLVARLAFLGLVLWFRFFLWHRSKIPEVP
jgi:hypothetical protein